MNRRNFLTGIAAVSLAGLITIVLPTKAQAQTNGKIFRGTAEGQIFESLDGGQTWQQTANFGQNYPVLNLFEDDDVLYAQLGFQGYHFWLTSQEARIWRTTDHQASILYLPILSS